MRTCGCIPLFANQKPFLSHGSIFSSLLLKRVIKIYNEKKA
ncbi:hypothetical protein B4073_1486 [Bacillus subtilis]|uniref:Uncharacterized protein n=1 Tax=Bacillus subtilis subsp. subtilis TaxID=135461 RepID=A0ABD3ZNJ8_BACIU|nr:hypothetical protein B4067_1674 [Bacillus subtilis subsp. subtilis]KIN33355.1 hypothetical protein B4069_1524 [Bacillus subtilis]KIN33836.1 hypothetical protein B4068_1500 [Bacillus subtilis]KIN41955.1 hypothetical protein B4070_1536 [Bacillus subtilis]KIN48242.1 hypothetical protein B4145_1612 [Bacillus subtilis]